MDKPVSADLSHAAIATFMQNVRWEEVGEDMLRLIAKHPTEAGEMFTAIMKRPWTKHLRPAYPPWSSLVLSPPEKARKIGDAGNVFTDFLDAVFDSQLFQDDGFPSLERMVDVWEVSQPGTAWEILKDFGLKACALNQSLIVHLADRYAMLFSKKVLNCIPFEASGIPHVAIITVNERNRLSIRVEPGYSERQYPSKSRFIFARA